MISELKSNDCLKTDGQNCAVLLLGLRNEYCLHQNLLIAKDLTVKSLAIFFLYSLLLQALTAFLRRAETAILNAEPYQHGILHHFYGKSL